MDNVTERIKYRAPQPKLNKIDVTEAEHRSMVARRFRSARLRAGATGKNLGNVLGIDQSGVSKIEHGAIKLSAYDAVAAAMALGIELEDLLAIEDETSNDPS